MEEYLILVNDLNQQIGVAPKMLVHQKGLLHRAFSVVLIAQEISDHKNSEGGPFFLMQQRSLDKYHCPGLWSNACCGHPRPGEPAQRAAIRRLEEELNIKNPDLKKIAHFKYKKKVGNDLVEHEWDHVFLGRYRSCSFMIKPNPMEVSDYRWIPLKELVRLVKSEPHLFTPWLPEVLSTIIAFGI